MPETFASRAPMTIPRAIQNKGGVRVATIAAGETWTRQTSTIQILDGGVADRTIVLPAEADCDGIHYLVRNSGTTNALIHNDDSGATIATLDPGEWAHFACESTVWSVAVSSVLANLDLNGGADALILDADGDTTISAPTDNQIDFEINGADDFVMIANIFRALSGSSIETDTVNETTAGSGVTVDGVLIKDSHIVDSVGFYDAAAPTKIVRLDAGSIVAGNTRVITMPDNDVNLGSPTFVNLKVTGKLAMTGTPVLVDAEHVDLRSNYLLGNMDYTTAVGQTGGLVVNYLPTATVDTTVGAGVVVAGVDGVSDPTITTAGAATFAITDFVMLSGSENDGENDGLYEVQAHAGNVLTFKSTSNGISNRVEDFTLDQLTANASDVGISITKVTVTVLRNGTDGIWEVGSGSQTGIAYSNLVRVSDSGSIFQAYDATLLSLAALGTAADKGLVSTGVDTWAEFALSPFALTVLDDANAATARTTLGVGTGDTPSFANAAVTSTATPSGTGVVATSEQLQVRTLLLTLTNTPVVMADNPAVTAYGSLKIVDLPEGNIAILGAVMDLALTLSAAGINAGWDGDVGLGTVAANNGATPLATTEQNIIPNTATPQAVASATTAKAWSTATELAAGVFNGTSAAVDVYLNLLVDDADHDVTTTPTNILCNGTIRITYVNLGDVA